MTITLFVIYRSPTFNLTDFLSDYYNYFTNCPIDENISIIGNFNKKMNITTYDFIEFNKLFNSLNHKQHIKFPTHIGNLLGNILDLILTLQESTITSNIHTITNTIADHYTIKSNINFRKNILIIKN